MPKLKALVLTSKSLRHRYFAKKVAEVFDVLQVISEEKKNYYTKQSETSSVCNAHFRSVEAAEMDFFGKELEEKQNEYWEVDNINSQTCISKAVSLGPDVICLFGTSILNQNWLEAFPKRVVNLHLGLSPFYRGSATLFWPFFFKELKYLGATIHLATAKVDAGEIIARIDADFRLEDDYYNITTRLIKDSIDRFPEVVASYLGGWIKTFAQENVDGRICRKSDFSEEALREVLEYIGRGLTAKEIAKIHKERACRYLG